MSEVSVTQERGASGSHPGFWATILTGRDNKSADIGRVLFAAAVITAISYVSFVLWLKVPLPLGILEEVLG